MLLINYSTLMQSCKANYLEKQEMSRMDKFRTGLCGAVRFECGLTVLSIKFIRLCRV